MRLPIARVYSGKGSSLLFILSLNGSYLMYVQQLTIKLELPARVRDVRTRVLSRGKGTAVSRV